MSDGNPSRDEIYGAIDRLERSLKSYLDQGFDGLNNRMDTANGRTTKNEDTVKALEVQVGILLDRSNATRKVVNPLTNRIKWVPFASSGALIAIVEFVKALMQ